MCVADLINVRAADRQLAADARASAESSSLPQVKVRYLRSAEQFEDLVAKLEGVARAKARNEAALTEPDENAS